MANTETIRILTQEVSILTERTKPAGTGYLYTAIDVINGRIAELKLEAAKEMSVSEQMQEELEPLPHSYDYGEEQARLRRIQEEDVYDGYKEHTEAMEQARLREIQDKAAGRKPNAVRDAYLHSSKVKPMEGENLKDDYEHTKEYYDTERNRAPSIQTMTSDGLSNRTMKQKYGQAIMTVSEMMQDELEPLPINTFE